jgi:ubiquinone/menaquinone biosynthesis C-methylase UbiE
MPPAASLRPRVGNAYDKYATRNPLAALLTRRFLADLDTLVADLAPRSVLDVGCGEGFVTDRLADLLGDRPVLGVDREPLPAAWAQRTRPGLSFEVADARRLPYAARSFDLVCGIELLEQVPRPELALAELVRVAATAVIVSVPREPIWRILNCARGAYVRWLGNPPGHVNHFSRAGFVALAGAHAPLAAVRSPFPWTIVALRVR